MGIASDRPSRSGYQRCEGTGRCSNVRSGSCRPSLSPFLALNSKGEVTVVSSLYEAMN